jgi:NADPH2:quinone reductase
MALAIRIYSSGAPEVMQLEELDLPSPGPGEVLLEQTAIGVNPLDVNQRKGWSRLHCLRDWVWRARDRGRRGLGSVGPEVRGSGRLRHRSAGRVCQCAPVPADRLIRLPDALGDDAAASVLFKGITAQYLLKTTGQVKQGSRVLIYGAAGALGQLMCAWAKHLGAQVLGVVSKPASVERAKAAGCDQVFVFDAQSLPSQVMQATQGQRWTWSTTPSEKTLSPLRWTACDPEG